MTFIRVAGVMEAVAKKSTTGYRSKCSGGE
jgi:hypothetical protein